MSEADKIILIVLYTVFSLGLIVQIVFRIKNEKRITLNGFFEIYLLLVYGITPVVTLSLLNEPSKTNEYFYTYDSKYYYWLFLLTVIFYVVYLVTFYILNEKYRINRRNVKTIDVGSKRFFAVAVLLSIVGIVAILLWAHAYGWPWDVIRNASIIRSGASKVYNPFSFMKPLCSFVVMAFYCNLVMIRKTQYKKTNLALLIINGAFSVFFLLANDSRMFMLVFILAIILYYFNKNIHINAKTVVSFIGLAVLTLVVLANIDNVTYFIRSGNIRENNNQNSLVSGLSEFSFTYRNGVNVLYRYDNGELVGAHEMIDIKNILLFLVPEKLNAERESLTTLNTTYYEGISGHIPTDIITAAIYKFHLAGIVIMPIFMAGLLYLAEKFFGRYKSDFMVLVYNFLGCNTCLRFVAYYDLSNILRSNIYIIVSVAIVCFLWSKKFERINKKWKFFSYLREPSKFILHLMNKGSFRFLPDKIYLRLKYRLKMGKELNLEDPKTFNEKIQWLKIHDRKDIYTTMVDKYEVKKYVADIIGKQYIVPTLGVYDKFDDIDFDKLPNQFVIKCTHDSGGLVICRDKAKLDKEAAKRKINKSLKRNYYYSGREWPYKNVKPRILLEEYMEDKNVHELVDYKVMCFNGKAKMIFTCTERFGDGLKVTWFDLDWNKLPFERHYPASKKNIPKPKNLKKMIELSEKLSKGIPFVRMDWYEINGKLYFGEYTFYPGAGLEEFTPEEWDYKLGALIDLSLVEKK